MFLSRGKNNNVYFLLNPIILLVYESWVQGESKLSLVLRKPVFGVSDHVRHKPGRAATDLRLCFRICKIRFSHNDAQLHYLACSNNYTEGSFERYALVVNMIASQNTGRGRAVGSEAAWIVSGPEIDLQSGPETGSEIDLHVRQILS